MSEKPNYQERPVEGQGDDIKNSINRYLLMVPYCRGKRTFDFGCGEGYGTATLHSYGINVAGYEPYVDVIKKAIEKFPDCKFTCQEAYQFIERPHNFDIIVCNEVIEHMPTEDLRIVLKKFSDHVPEFIGSTPSYELFPYKPKTEAERIGFHYLHYSYLELEALFKEFYKFVTICGCSFDPRIGRYTNHVVFSSNR